MFKKQLAGNGADVLGMQWMLNRSHGATVTRPFGMRVNNVALAGDGAITRSRRNSSIRCAGLPA